MSDEAKCRKGILHDFEISQDLPNVLLEVCRFCGEKGVYRKVNGRYDAIRHLRAHLRDTLQPHGRTSGLFKQIYGIKGIKIAEQARKKFISRQNRDEERAELHEKRVFLRKQAFKGQGKSTKEIEEELKRFKHKTTGLQ